MQGPSGSVLLSSQSDSTTFLQPYYNGLRTTGFTNGGYYGSGANGADYTTHEASDATGGGYICFADLSSTSDSSTPKYNIRLSNQAGTTFYYGDDVEITGSILATLAPIGTITINKTLDGGSCALTYVSPAGTCYHGNLNTVSGGTVILSKDT